MTPEQLNALRAEDAELYVSVQTLTRESNGAMGTDPKISAKIQRRQVIQALFSEIFDEILVKFDESREAVAKAKDDRQDFLLALEGSELKVEQAEANEMRVWQQLRNLSHDTDRKPPRKPGVRSPARRGQINSFSDVPIGPT